MAKQDAGKARGTDGTKLVIVESPAKAKTIGGYLGPGYVVEASIGHIRELPPNAAAVPRSTRASHGRVSAWTSTTISSPSTSSAPTASSRSPNFGAWSRTRPRSTSPRTRTARARPSPGTWSRRSNRACRSSGWSSTRSRPARSPRRSRTHVTSTSSSSTPSAPARSSTGSTGTRSARSCGRRCCRDCRRGGCSPSRPAWSSSASANGWPSTARNTGTSRARCADRAQAERPRHLQRHAGQRRRHPAGHRARLRPGHRPGAVQRAAPRRGGCARARRPARGPRVLGHRRRGEAVPPPAVPAVHDEHPAAGGRPQVPLVVGDGDARGAAVVRERLHHLHAHRLDEPVDDGAPRRGHRRASSTATRMFPPNRGSIRARSRTPRRRTRPSVRPATRSALPARSRTSCPPTSPSLRADLAAHARIADGRRGRHDGVGAHRRDLDDRRVGRVHDQRPHDHVPRLPARVRRGRGRAGRFSERLVGQRRCGAPAAATGPRRRARGARVRGGRDTTNPPARYTEPSLVKAMEELGVGRPSTYASIMQTIQDRGYVFKKGAALSRRGRRSRSSGCSSRTSRGWWTTGSPPRSRTTWTTSPTASDRASTGCAGSTSAPTTARRTRSGSPRRAVSAADRVAAGGDRRARGQLDPAQRQWCRCRVGRYGPYLERGSGDPASARPSRTASRRTS